MLQDNLNYNNKSSHGNLSALHESHVGTVSRTSSVLSLSGLDVSEPDLDVTGPVATLVQVLSGQFRKVRLAPFLHLVVFSLMMYGTFSDAAYRISNESSSYGMKNSPPKEGKGLLGTAMISSVTGALSPILPFAGGIDLRRNENWGGWRSWMWSFKESNGAIDVETEMCDLGQKISSIPRGGARSHKIIRKASDLPMVLSASVPFLSEDDIAGMTLREIAITFRYAIEAGREDFDLETFLSKPYGGLPVNSRMKKAVRAIDDAVVRSRGEGVIAAKTSIDMDLDETAAMHGPLSDKGYGDVDALQFCGAMRILAEWRVLRQVPPGYKQYAVGMTLGHKDVVQNVAKIESAVHEWIATRSDEEAEAMMLAESMRESCAQNGGGTDDCPVKISEVPKQRRSPTLRQLLQHEIDNNTHTNSRLPRLKDKTAAMGLLWVRRQLQYQTTIFDNVISVPKLFSTAIEAVGAAYGEVYGDFHGWAVQKIFNYSFQSAPKTDTIFRHMNPRRLDEVTKAAVTGATSGIIQAEENDETDMIIPILSTNGHHNQDGNPFIEFFDNVGAELDKFGRHIGGEWDKVGHFIGAEWDKTVCNVSNMLHHDRNIDCETTEKVKIAKSVLLGGAKTKQDSVGEDTEVFISQQMKNDAKDHILVYLHTVRPMLNDLAGLFDEMNMDDPTKV